MWYQIGTVLRVPDAILQSLQLRNTLDFIKMDEVIQCWINQHTTEVTWETIIAAMRNDIVRQNHVAEKIEKYIININHSGDTPSKRSVGSDVSTSSKKYSRVPNEAQRSEYSMLLK